MTFGWIWVAVIVMAIVIEVFTEQLVSIWFVPAAIVGIFLDFFKVPEIWQIIVVLILAAAGIVATKIVFTKYTNQEDTKTNINAIIGERCIVIEKIDNYAGCGQVKVKGQIWSARGVGEDDIFDVGVALHVVAIEGVKLICKE